MHSTSTLREPRKRPGIMAPDAAEAAAKLIQVTETSAAEKDTRETHSGYQWPIHRWPLNTLTAQGRASEVGWLNGSGAPHASRFPLGPLSR